MTRLLVPLATPDVSAFGKTLKNLLDQRHAAGKAPPSHVELLNLLARAVGLRNFATLKKTALAAPAAAVPGDVPVAAQKGDALDLSTLSTTARKALLQFDAAGRLVRLPNKLSVQQMTMWALWTQFVAHRRYTEKEVNAISNAFHTFGDQATLRRELVNMKLLGRKSDCSEYWKEPQRPAPEVQAFLRAWRAGLR
ncbi:MAG: DUF2087 domain-containing protein [Rhodoferax sp.]|uniref:DUF2087 domain-containing protein n=1 Tax=Rhodoferax sp. TaxID=50421 RepID=UPI0026334D5C|nr:DUF2087 domain-containing protein [Rhodoferax sp.]MDD5332786.1 DUF2087 domain-containing protein [Rhodoferax sp.]